MRITRKPLLFAGLAALVFGVAGPLSSQDPEETWKKQDSAALKAILASGSKYSGASKCKMCHNKAEIGDTYAIWEKSGHAKAFATLQSDKAKEIAKEKGIEDASKAPECLKCHVTAAAYMGDEEKVGAKFKFEEGVGCEVCHGPGLDHQKARLDAKSKPSADRLPEVPEGEIFIPDLALCSNCHNEESPTFKEFKPEERLKAIAHLHPLREKPRVAPPEPKKKEKEEGE